MRRATVSSAGSTFVELVVATAIATTVIAATFAVLDQGRGGAGALPETSDMQQRLRVSVDVLRRDLLMAGAGPASGPAAGPLHHYLAPVLPYRTGGVNPDPPATFRSDAVSVIYVPAAAAQATIAGSIASTTASVALQAGPPCPPGDDVCGFAAGMTVAVFDDTGACAIFDVANARNGTLDLQARSGAMSRLCAAGATIVQVVTRTYELGSGADAAQLRQYDGRLSDLPLVDDVIDVRFEYFGEARPPELIPPISPATRPRMTYGPRPPARDEDDPFDAWPAGESCLVSLDSSTGGQRVRPELAPLDLRPGAVVPLDPNRLVDGPWCPDADAPTRWDADLLRVRRIRVTLRVQVASAIRRGAIGGLLWSGGWSRGGYRFAPDQEIRFDVTPRNLNLGGDRQS